MASYYVVWSSLYLLVWASFMPLWWTEYGKLFPTKGSLLTRRMTGFMFGIMGVGQVFHILIGTFIINPRNESADLIENYNGITYKYFKADIARNLIRYIIVTLVLQIVL